MSLPLSKYPTKKGVAFLTPISEAFEQAYLDAREQEGRVYPDAVVQQLPKIEKAHAQAQEWQVRQRSTDRLLAYLHKRRPKGPVLDLGCGNGWFTRHLALAVDGEVLGMDINLAELEQAARLFGSDTCHFAYGDIFEADLPEGYFSLIVLNSVVQYFPSLSELLQRLLPLLSSEGELHILDSPFYPEAGIEAAKDRTVKYYQQQGKEAMIAFYHHHSIESLDRYSPKYLYRPNSLFQTVKRRFLAPDSPFPWICILAPASHASKT